MALQNFQFVGGSSLDDFNTEMANKVDHYKRKMASYKQDWDWFDYHSCQVHGRSCPAGAMEVNRNGAINQLKYSKENVESYINNQLSDFPKKLRDEMRAQGSTKGMVFDDEYLKEYSAGGTIKRMKYFIAWYINEENKTITVFNFTAKIERSSGQDHQFLATYWDGNDDRIENALSYHIGNLFKDKFPALFN